MRKFLIILCLAALALAACGSSDNGDIDVASKKSSASAKDSTDGTDPDFSGKGAKNFCAYLLDLKKNEGALNLTGDNSEEDKKRAEKGLEVLDNLQDKAPAEIKADVVLVVKQIRPFFEATAKGETYKPDPAKQPTEAENKEFEAAGARLTAYSTNVCGLKSDTTTTSEPTSTTSDGQEQTP